MTTTKREAVLKIDMSFDEAMRRVVRVPNKQMTKQKPKPKKKP